MINKIRRFKYTHTAPYSVDKHKNTYESMFTYMVDDGMEIEGEAIKIQLTDYSHKNPNPNPHKLISICDDVAFTYLFNSDNSEFTYLFNSDNSDLK